MPENFYFPMIKKILHAIKRETTTSDQATLKVRFTFNSLTVEEFSIKNPKVIPWEGMPVSFHYEDFVSCGKTLQWLEANEDLIDLRCQIVYVKYVADEIEMLVLLMEEKDYFPPTFYDEKNVERYLYSNDIVRAVDESQGIRVSRRY